MTVFSFDQKEDTFVLASGGMTSYNCLVLSQIA